MQEQTKPFWKRLTSILTKSKLSLVKLFVSVVIVMEKDKYPYYEKLSDVGFIIINAEIGGFVFQIKEDVNLRKLHKGRFNIPRRFYTVELISIDDPGPNGKVYEDKIMLTVKVNIFTMSKKTLIDILVDMYLNKMLIKLDEKNS